MRTIIIIAYLVIGVLVAAARDYLGAVGNLGDIVNLLLAILLWPLLLLGVDFNLRIGGGGGRDRGGNGRNGALPVIGPALVCARAALGRGRSAE
ncbi:MAG: hypothetical protein ACRDK3_11925 [Actinomycetota bacterium]